ncbi:small nuclear ribonucleoprotein E-like [Kogia breviceps]|uniref:small nuclear ribonucleoprotein E-like n=1 Tax=Kogia breviceps TaxID=27615 RepID=UPI0034D1E088
MKVESGCFSLLPRNLCPSGFLPPGHPSPRTLPGTWRVGFEEIHLELCFCHPGPPASHLGKAVLKKPSFWCVGVVWSWRASTAACQGQGRQVQTLMVHRIDLSFRCFLQHQSRIQVWLYEQVSMRIEGCTIGFDEYMNLVLDGAEEIHSKTKSRKRLSRIKLKGDKITLLESVSN